MIDLEKLEEVANRGGDKEVVTRRWLRQVLAELRQARQSVGLTVLPAAALDVPPPQKSQ